MLWKLRGAPDGRAWRVSVCLQSLQSLSPDLYGIFGQVFADYVAAKDAADPAGMRTADCPVLTGGLPLPLLVSADDLSLFAYSRARKERKKDLRPLPGVR